LHASSYILWFVDNLEEKLKKNKRKPKLKNLTLTVAITGQKKVSVLIGK
jgi:hypothetical protein